MNERDRPRLKGHPHDRPTPQPKADGLHPIDWLCEFIGTAFQLFLGFCFVALVESDRSPVRQALGSPALRLVLIGIAFGVLAAVVALSPVGRRSGAHLNPAVTLGFVLKGHTPVGDAIGYALAQVAGAIAAAAAFVAALPAWAPTVGSARTVPAPNIPAWGVVAIEAGLTLGLLLTVFTMLSWERAVRWTPAAVTAALAVLIWVGAPRTGASMNPARTFGPDLVSGTFPLFWAYVVGPLLGAALAVVVVATIARKRTTLTAKLYHDPDYPSVHATLLPAKPHRSQLPENRFVPRTIGNASSVSANADDNGRGFLRVAFENRRLAGVAIIAAIGGFLFGYDTGVIGGALLFMKKDLALKTPGQQQLTVAVLLLGAIAGALIAGWTADRISRRRTKIISGCVYVIGAIGCALAQSYWQILAGRFWLGIAVGCASFVSPMYIAEMVPPRIRGGLVSFNQLMITSGILAAYIVDWGFAPFSNNWRWMFLIAVVPGAALAIGMYFMPFSPRWLVDQGREDEARAVLSRYRDSDEEVDDEIAEIKEISSTELHLRDLVQKGLRKMLLVGVALAVFQQIVGINTVIYYSPTILKFAGQQNTGALTQSVFIGCTNVFFTIVAILLLDKLGRRFFLLGGTATLTAALVGLGVFFASASVRHSVGWLALVCLLVYIAGFAVGLGPVFWLMISEIFPLQMRGPAMAVCTMFNWGLNFAIAYTFLTLTNSITKAGTFWLYAFFGVCALAFFWLRVPETKNRSLEEIQADLGATDAPLSRDRAQDEDRSLARA